MSSWQKRLIVLILAGSAGVFFTACGDATPSGNQGADSTATPTPDADPASAELGPAPAWDAEAYPLFTGSLYSGKKAYKDLEEIKANLDDVFVVDLGDAELTEVPAVLFECKRLQKLDLSDNKLTSLPAELGKLGNLQQLNVSDNLLSALPRELGWLANLTELNCSENQLTGLPAEISRCGSLKSINLNDNKLLQGLPDAVLELKSLESLYAIRCDLHSLPELGTMEKLRYLTIERNPNLAKLPDSFDKLNFYEFSLSGCTKLDFEDAFAKLAKHSNLKKLHMQNVPLQEYSMFGGTPKQYEPLVLPDNLKDLQLTALNISYNSITVEMLAKVIDGCAGMPAFTSLNLSDVHVEAIPSNIGKLSNLEYITMWRMPITSLPAEFNQLTKLKLFSLAGCENVTSLPDLSALTELTEFDVEDCKLTEIPAWVARFSKLKTLELSSCPEITGLPDFLNTLTLLEDLDLAHCAKITSLPSLEGLDALEDVDMRKTGISEEDYNALKAQYPTVAFRWQKP